MVDEQEDERRNVAIAAMNSMNSFQEAAASSIGNLENPDSSPKLAVAVELSRQSSKVLVGLGQILASCATSYNVPWPASFSYVFELMSVMNISPYQLPGINCLYSDVRYFTRVSWYFVAPPLLALYIYFINLVLLRWVSRKTPESPAERCVQPRVWQASVVSAGACSNLVSGRSIVVRTRLRLHERARLR